MYVSEYHKFVVWICVALVVIAASKCVLTSVKTYKNFQIASPTHCLCQCPKITFRCNTNNETFVASTFLCSVSVISTIPIVLIIYRF